VAGGHRENKCLLGDTLAQWIFFGGTTSNKIWFPESEDYFFSK
jgi:hypothetical protein